MEKKRYIDLHIHSNNSDGALSPKEIFEEAKRLDLKMISITDHDTPNDLEVVQSLVDEDDSIIYVPGIEISSYFTDRKSNNIPIHILGYGCSPDNALMAQIISYQKDLRTRINRQYIETLLTTFSELSEELFDDVNCSQYFRIARAIISQVNSSELPETVVSEIKKYCNKNYPVYKDYDVASSEVINAITKADGIPILAHPLDYDLRDIEVKRMIKGLLDAGIQGFEAYSSTYKQEESEHLRMMAESYNTLYSVGSDFHFHSNDSRVKVMGFGIDNSLCVENTTLSDEIIKKSLQLKRGGRQ